MRPHAGRYFSLRLLVFALLIWWLPFTVFAVTVATAEHVEAKVETKVDVSASANQTMAGTYTVSGTLIVPTPALPSAE